MNNTIMSYKNKVNRANGQAFEDLISYSLGFYKEKGYANIEKTPEPMRVMRNLGGGRFEAIFTKQAQPDYKGVIIGGQNIIFEAKHTEKGRIQSSAVSSKQEEMFNDYEALGSLCFVFISFSLSSFYRVPWSEWKCMKEKYGRSYLKEEELGEWKLKSNPGIIYLLEGISY